MIDYGYGVSLGKIQERDLYALAFWRNSPEIMKWTRQYDLISPVQQHEWYKWQAKEPSVSMYAIKPKALEIDWSMIERPSLVGVCGFTSIDKHNRRAEFSLYIAPEYQRNGYGEKALGTLLDHGFKNHGFNRIWGETFEGNPAINLFEKVGMKKEGTFRSSYYKNGEWIDSHIVSILREEWL